MTWDIEKFENMNDTVWESMSAAEQNGYYSWQDEQIAQGCFTVFVVGVVIAIGLLIKVVFF